MRKMLQAVTLAIGLGAAAWGVQAQGNWQPSERITYLIGVAPGGSVDLYARGIKDTLESLKLSQGHPVVPEYKPGAGGGIALQQFKTKAGDGHWLSTFHTGSIAGAVSGLIRADVREFTPLAMMVAETTWVAVRAESPLKDGTDLVKALKADPTAQKIAIAPARGLNIHMALAKPLHVAGVEVDRLTTAPFRSSAESVTALLGGHVDVVSATAPVLLPHVASGKLRLLASASPEPATSGPLAAVKTWRQQGVAADYVSYNGVLLPPGMSDAQIRYWEDGLRKVAGDPAWIALVERSGNQAIFRDHAASKAYMHAEWASSTELVKALKLKAVP